MKKHIPHLLLVLVAMLFGQALSAQTPTAAELLAGRPDKSTYTHAPSNQAYWLAQKDHVTALISAWLADPSAEIGARETEIAEVYFQFLRLDLQYSSAAREVWRRAGRTERLQATVRDPAEYAQVKAAGWVVDGLELPIPARAAMALHFEDWTAFDPLPRSEVSWPVTPTAYNRWLNARLEGKTTRQRYDFLVAEIEAWSANASRVQQVLDIRADLQRRADTAFVQLRREQLLGD